LFLSNFSRAMMKKNRGGWVGVEVKDQELP